MTRPIEIVVNPASGSKLGLALAEEHVKPLLISALGSSDASNVRIRQTESEGDGIRIGDEIARDYLAPVSGDGVEPEVDIVVIGGDGTTHELLNGIFLQQDGQDVDPRRKRKKESLGFRLAIVPGGTANALYSAMYPGAWTQEVQQQVAAAETVHELNAEVLEVMLKSIRLLASSLPSKAADAEEQLVPLPMMLNFFPETKKSSISHLVTSHALHAAILHDADTPEMRTKHKGIERFKAAAQMNATRWTHGSVALAPGSSQTGGGAVLRYSTRTRKFEPVPESGSTLAGPFLYLNAMVTDRLESAFIPAPLSSAFSHSDRLPSSSIDVVAIRPLRDPTISRDQGDEKTAGVHFATTRLGEITAGMYNGGKHIDLTYSEAEDEPMVEYFRCQGFGFLPDVEGLDEEGAKKCKLACTDGFISSPGQSTVMRWEEGLKLPALKRGLKTPLVWR